MLKSFSINMLNKTINKALATDPDSLETLKPLQDKVLAIHIKGVKNPVFCLFSDAEITLCDTFEGKANTTISGGPFSLLSTLITKDLNNSGITIEGEIETLQHIQKFAETFEFDWEAQLAELIGDTPAYHLHKAGQKFSSIFKKRKTTFCENSRDYLVSEKQLLVDPIELEAFFDEVDDVHLATERLNDKLKRLQKEMT